MTYIIIIIIAFWIWVFTGLLNIRLNKPMLKIKEDGTVWEAEFVNQDDKTLVIECTDAFCEYYKMKYGSSADPLSNKYSFDQIEFIK